MTYIDVNTSGATVLELMILCIKVFDLLSDSETINGYLRCLINVKVLRSSRTKRSKGGRPNITFGT